MLLRATRCKLLKGIKPECFLVGWCFASVAGSGVKEPAYTVWHLFLPELVGSSGKVRKVIGPVKNNNWRHFKPAKFVPVLAVIVFW